VNYLEGWSRVILVDAAQMGLAPGSWRRFHIGDISLEATQGALSLHNPGLAEGLALAQALQTLPEEVDIYCVEPESTADGVGLSPAVEAVLPTLVADIIRELWKKQE
jgi:hydrogenase maturation protease